MPTKTPQRIGAYRVVRALSPQKSFVADDEAGRRVVLKLLDPDCLQEGQLHPSIHDRLSRVRELAQSSVANLFGVERDLDLVYMVWEYVDAASFVDYASSPDLNDRDLISLMRELALAIEALHARGIVHGAIHDGNVFVDSDGRIHLTDISPLLYHDPAVDERAVLELLRETARARTPLSDEIAKALDALDNQHTPLRELTDQLAALAKPDDPGRVIIEERPGRLRLRTIITAFVVAIVGITTVFVVRAYVLSQIRKGTPPSILPAPSHAEK